MDYKEEWKIMKWLWIILIHIQNISNICSQDIYNDKALIAHIVAKLSEEIYGTAIGDKNLGRIIEIQLDMEIWE